MRIVCYFADADGSHPECSSSDYDKLWPVMQKSVEKAGYSLTHLTSLSDRQRCDDIHRADIDPKTVMFSREVAWLDLLRSTPDGEQVVLVEPDAYLLRPIPPLVDGDMVMLRRSKSLPCGFRLCTNRAIPFYEAVVDLYKTYPIEDQVFHGDVKVHHKLLGIGPMGAVSFPGECCGVRIEVRDWLDYTSKLWSKAVAWNFKGTSKHIMLGMADGVMPRMR